MGFTEPIKVLLRTDGIIRVKRKEVTGHACCIMLVSCFLLLFHGTNAFGETEEVKDCLLELIENSASDVTVGDIRDACAAAHETGATIEPVAAPEASKSAIDRRLAMEGATEVIPFVVTPHNPNYILYTYNFKDYRDPDSSRQTGEDASYKSSEVDFQVSLKFPLMRNILKTKTHLFAAYTNHSFWQVFDSSNSAPFRATDHEPELWLSHRTRRKMFGLTHRLAQAGVVHQSNGRSGEFSRSWNRVYANMVFERGNFYFGVKPWLRIQEDRGDDDNPDIEDYLGYFEFQGVYNRNQNNYGLFFRNTLKDGYRGAIQLDWGFPLHEHVRAYVQYFYGYGESLIDYNRKVNKLGVGIKLTDWL